MFLWFSLLPVFLNPCYTCFLLCSIPWYLCLCVHVYVFDIFETGSPYVNPDSSRTYSVDHTCLLLTKICLFLSPSCWGSKAWTPCLAILVFSTVTETLRSKGFFILEEMKWGQKGYPSCPRQLVLECLWGASAHVVVLWLLAPQRL